MYREIYFKELLDRLWKFMMSPESIWQADRLEIQARLDVAMLSLIISAS